MAQGADHVESALELDVIRLPLHFVVPVREGVVPPLQHNACRHGCAAWCITLAKGLQHHCTSRTIQLQCCYARAMKIRGLRKSSEKQRSPQLRSKHAVCFSTSLATVCPTISAQGGITVKMQGKASAKLRLCTTCKCAWSCHHSPIAQAFSKYCSQVNCVVGG